MAGPALRPALPGGGVDPPGGDTRKTYSGKFNEGCCIKFEDASICIDLACDPAEKIFVGLFFETKLIQTLR